MGTALKPGALIAGRYQLRAPLGRGGMGAVWSAVHVVTRRELALKFLRGPAHQRPDLRRRFLREARAACTVAHPNVVAVHDLLEHDEDTPVMVMDLLKGETLGDRLRRVEALTVDEAVTILAQVTSAIGTAHARGIVHRDLKPDNVFLLAGSDEVRVLDFGVAKLFSGEGQPEAAHATRTGTLVGTPCYMAPEQATGERDIDHRVDVWALGVVLYECLSGARPIEGDSLGQVIVQLLNTGIAPLCRVAPHVPEELGALADRMLARDRHRRPADLREVAEVLARHSDLRVPAFGAPGSEASRELVFGPDDAEAFSTSARAREGRSRRALAMAAAGALGAVILGLSLSRLAASPEAAGAAASAERSAAPPEAPATLLSAAPDPLATVQAAAPPRGSALASAPAEATAPPVASGVPVAASAARLAPRPSASSSAPATVASSAAAPPPPPEPPSARAGGLVEKAPY